MIISILTILLIIALHLLPRKIREKVISRLRRVFVRIRNMIGGHKKIIKELVIRKAQKKNASKIAKLFMLAWPVEDILKDINISYKQLHKFITQIAKSEQTIYSYENTYIAVADGKIVGAMCAYNGADYQRLKQPIVDILGKDSMFAHLKETEAGEFYIDSVGVLEGYRGRGIASKLFAAQIERARSLGLKTVGLIVDEDKPQAEALYTRLGFSVLDNKEFFGHPMKHMVINLD